MTYSKTHQRFADHLNNQRALEHPEEFLGVNYKDVLNFWWFLDDLSEYQLKIVGERYLDLDYKVRCAAGAAAWAAAYDADAWDASAWDAAYWGGAARAAAGLATWELIGSHRLLEQGKSLVFLPLFLKRRRLRNYLLSIFSKVLAKLNF
jgi:hypothetical protein